MEALRAAARPGSPFVDAGGVEECFPTVRGDPDHGDAWSRPWSIANPDDGQAWVDTGDLRLVRRLSDGPTGVRATYLVQGPPGTRFVHAVHALLAVGTRARLLLPTGRRARLLDTPRPGSVTETTWPPEVAGRTMDRLGPPDGTAAAALVTDCRHAVVIDGSSALEMSWAAATPGPAPVCSLLVWRNLGGWPDDAPYRSIGVEPMAGRTATLHEILHGAPSEDAAAIGPDGRFTWEVRLTAWQRAAPGAPTGSEH